MKKTTKGALAAVAGGSLLFGGAGSLAYWTDSDTVTGATINSGSLTLGAPDCTTEAGTHDWQFDNGDTFTPASDTIVPGDTVSKICTLTLTLVGSHIGATLGAAGATFATANDLTAELVPTATFTVAGDPLTDPITAAGTYLITAELEVVFDGATATNDSQSLSAALDSITVTATQTHDVS